MQVSQFELVYKLQSPAGPADTVLQGYFLEISNLEKIDLFFQLSFVTSSVNDPDRSLFNNTFVIVDIPDIDNNFNYALNGGPTSASFSLNRFVTIPAKGTALVAVLPSDPFSMPGDPPAMPDFEARGYVEITLPAKIQTSGSGGFGFSRIVPQLDRKAKVLLTPQNRATYLGQTGMITDQTQASVPTASGAALNEITPQKNLVFQPAGKGLDLGNLVPAMLVNEITANDLGAMIALADMSDLDVKALNAELRNAGVGMQLEKSKATKPAKSKRSKETA